MPSNAPQPRSPLTLSLYEARQSLDSPAAISDLVDRLEDLSAWSIHDMGPLVFDVVRLGPEFPVADLLKRMLDKRPEWISQLENAQNLLSCAFATNRFDLVDVLIDAGVDPAYENSSGFGVLDFASSGKFDPQAPQVQESCGNSLLKSGVCSSTQKDRALKNAAKNGNLGMVKSLLAHGAGFDTKFMDGTALSCACDTVKKSHQTAIVQALLQAPDVDQVLDHGWGSLVLPSALHRAATWGNVQVVSMLLEAGASVNPPEDLSPHRCQTPLMSASGSLHPEIMSLLIKSGAQANATDGFGRNAFHHLAGHNSWNDSYEQQPDRLKAIAILFDAGADPAQPDDDGSTPLDHAVRSGDPAVIEAFMLLEAQNTARQLNGATQHTAAPRTGPSRRL